MRADFLIVGQGLAGSMLAWHLIQRGTSVLILDPGLQNASQVAAGLINPLPGKRLLLVRQIEACLSIAKQFYRSLETQFQQPLLFEKPMLRVFQSQDEADFGYKRLADQNYRIFLSDKMNLDSCFTGRFGSLMQLQSGYVLVSRLLANLKQFFLEREVLREERLDYSDLKVGSRLSWRHISVGRVIFCEGYEAMLNPWFRHLPFQPSKGEILTYQWADKLPDFIINAGQWLIPLEDRRLRIGAGFDRQHLDQKATLSERAKLEARFKEFGFDCSRIQPLSHLAGVRPGTADKQAFIGFHPYYPQLAIFNGFGAKGSLLIPWYSQHFSKVLLGEKQIDPTVDVNRYAVRF